MSNQIKGNFATVTNYDISVRRRGEKIKYLLNSVRFLAYCKRYKTKHRWIATFPICFQPHPCSDFPCLFIQERAHFGWHLCFYSIFLWIPYHNLAKLLSFFVIHSALPYLALVFLPFQVQICELLCLFVGGLIVFS